MNRLRDIREDNGYKQQDIAKKLKIGRTTYTDYENEVTLILVEPLCKLADLYKLSTDYLLCLTDKRDPYELNKRRKKNRLIELRNEFGYSQFNISNVLKCSQSVYCLYEKGLRKISVDKLIELTKLYNVSLDYLLGRTGVKKPYPKTKK